MNDVCKLDHTTKETSLLFSNSTVGSLGPLRFDQKKKYEGDKADGFCLKIIVQ